MVGALRKMCAICDNAKLHFNFTIVIVYLILLMILEGNC